MENWIEIFKAGEYPNQGVYTAKDLAAIAEAYDKKIHEAPITVDHKQEGPAYGWVSELKVEGEKLFARFAQVADELKAAIADGRLKKQY